MKIYNSKLDRIVYKINALLLCAVVISVLYPLVYILIASFTDPTTLLNEGISFNISNWTLEGYIKILSDPAMIRGFFNSLIYSTFICLNKCINKCYSWLCISSKRFSRKTFYIKYFCSYNVFWRGIVPTYL